MLNRLEIFPWNYDNVYPYAKRDRIWNVFFLINAGIWSINFSLKNILGKSIPIQNHGMTINLNKVEINLPYITLSKSISLLLSLSSLKIWFIAHFKWMCYDFCLLQGLFKKILLYSIYVHHFTELLLYGLGSILQYLL